jgi:CelD/BcsL family acetyltransferase involved in cellulose biosynthesis
VSPSPGSSPLETRRWTGLEGLRALEQAWKSLHGEAGLFARYEWHSACAEHLLGDASAAAYIQVRRAGRTVAILPAILCDERAAGLGRVRALTLGVHSHLALADFPCSSGVRMPELAAAIRAELDAWSQPWDLLHWPRVLEDSNPARLGRAWDRASACVAAAPPCNTVPTGRDFEDVFSGLSKNLRASLRKSKKRLEEHGGFTILRAGGDRYQAFLELEASGWKGQDGTGSAIRLNPDVLRFYQDLLDRRSADFAPEVTLLCKGDRPISAQYAIRVADWLHVLKIGYDESEARFSPGQVLMEAVLEHACRGGVESVSLVTDMPWHKPWRPVARPALNIQLFRRTWRAVLHRAYRGVRSLAVHAVKGARRPLARADA